MASYAIQRRRGTAAEHGSFTGLAGELTVNTTRNSIHVHDASTAGGHELAKSTLANLGTTAINASLLVCLLYTSPSPRDKRQARMPSSA